MLATFYALLTDEYVLDAPIYVFDNLLNAQEALAKVNSELATIIPFTATDELALTTSSLVYLATTLEDTGIRIHAAFRSILRLRSYVREFMGESMCLQAFAWLDPLRKKSTTTS